MEIYSSPTVDPHESRQAAASRMEDCSDVVDLPVVIMQLDEGCYRGPSISKSARRVIAIEARKSYILNFFSAVLWQRPLVPADASSVHKVQSLTLQLLLGDAIHFQAACSIYVSFSRVKELGHLALLRPLTWDDIEKHWQKITMITCHFEYLRSRTGQ